jgi:hypothetical protein
MIGQGVIMNFVDFNNENDTVAYESRRLVNTVLPIVAKAVFKAMIVVYVDVEKYGGKRKQFGITHD